MQNPDIGDSAITETFGVGAMSMIAAPVLRGLSVRAVLTTRCRSLMK